MDSEEKRQRNILAKRKYRANMSPEKKENERLKRQTPEHREYQRLASQKHRAKMTPEQKEARRLKQQTPEAREKMKIAQRKYWAKMNPEKKEEVLAKNRERDKERRQQSERREAIRLAGKKYRANMDPEKKKAGYSKRREAPEYKSYQASWMKNKYATDDRYREKTLQRYYGINLQTFTEKLAVQNGRCAICGTDRPGNKKLKTLVVDHCHQTGLVRGLLCQPCNNGLGNFKDNVELLRAAVEYIEQYHPAEKIRKIG